MHNILTASATLGFVMVASAHIAAAATFTWRVDTPGVITGPTSLTQTVDGITVSASGFVAELGFQADNPDGYSDATVIGPFPTASTDALLRPFGIDLRELGGEQLGLNVDPEPGVPAASSDTGGGGVNPGFDSGGYPNLGDFRNRFLKFDFALFEFSSPVDIGSVLLDDAANSPRDAWFAYAAEAPDFSSGFLAGIAPYDIINGRDDASDGIFEHVLDIEDVSYLLVGAPPRSDLGPLEAGSSQFYVDSFADVALSDTEMVDPAPIPLPATILFGLTGLLGFALVGWRRGSR